MMTCPDAATCDANVAPVVGPVDIILNGVRVDALETVLIGDEVTFVVPFVDADCNVACGTYETTVTVPGDSSDDIQDVDAGMPCSSDESGRPFRFPYTVDRAGTYGFTLTMTDFCGATSNVAEASFTVQEE